MAGKFKRTNDAVPCVDRSTFDNQPYTRFTTLALALITRICEINFNMDNETDANMLCDSMYPMYKSLVAF